MGCLIFQHKNTWLGPAPFLTGQAPYHYRIINTSALFMIENLSINQHQSMTDFQTPKVHVLVLK
jgi:hypothetical protein